MCGHLPTVVCEFEWRQWSLPPWKRRRSHPLLFPFPVLQALRTLHYLWGLGQRLPLRPPEVCLPRMWTLGRPQAMMAMMTQKISKRTSASGDLAKTYSNRSKQAMKTSRQLRKALESSRSSCVPIWWVSCTCAWFVLLLMLVTVLV